MDQTPSAANLADGSTDPASGFSLASMMMFVTLVSVELGVSTIAPGVGIPLGIVLLVVWLRTAAVARRRAVRGLATTRAERVQLFFTSFGATVVMIVLMCVGGIVAFFAAIGAVCAHDGVSNVASEQRTADVEMIVFGVLAPAILILTIWWIVRVTRRRWRRDVGKIQSLDNLTWALAVLAVVIAAITVVWLLFAISSI